MVRRFREISLGPVLSGPHFFITLFGDHQNSIFSDVQVHLALQLVMTPQKFHDEKSEKFRNFTETPQTILEAIGVSKHAQNYFWDLLYGPPTSIFSAFRTS